MNTFQIEWMKGAISAWRRILSESLKNGDTNRAVYAYKLLSEVLVPDESVKR